MQGVLRAALQRAYTLSCQVTSLYTDHSVELSPEAILKEFARSGDGKLDTSAMALLAKNDGTCSYNGVPVMPDKAAVKEDVPDDMYQAFMQEEWEKQEQAVAALKSDAQKKAEAMLGKVKTSVVLAPQVAGAFPELDITVANGHDKMIENPSFQISFYEDGALLDKVDARVGGRVSPGETKVLQFSSSSSTRLIPHMKKGTDVRARLTGFTCEKLKIDESGSAFIPEELLKQ